MPVCFVILPRDFSGEQFAHSQGRFPSWLFHSFGGIVITIFLSLAILLVPSGSLGSILSPMEGEGNFHSYFDVLNRWQSSDRVDVMVLVEITNADIKYEEKGNYHVGRFNFEVILEGPDGVIISEKKLMSTPRLDSVLAASRTSFQVFGLVLEDVPFREGKLTCRVEDTLRNKKGLLNRRKLAVSESVSDWSAEHSLRVSDGVTVEDPLFLAHAPMKSWDPGENFQGAGIGYLHDYIHPSRRYGLEQDHLQLFLPVWSSVGMGEKPGQHSGLQIQIISSDMNYSITDTLQFDDRGITALESGRPAGLFYELDINILPEGSYRMSIAPLNRAGRGQFVMFDVVWRLSALGNPRDQVLGEGRLVFTGKDLKEFLAATPAGQEKLLADFWSDLNPDPESPVNSVYLEFLYRKEYIRNFLGGFGPAGAVDPRGEVYLLLGPPDDIERRTMPMNYQDLEDAQIKTFQQFAPDRDGTGAKGDENYEQGGAAEFGAASGGIPMPQSDSGAAQILRYKTSSTRNHGFELWKYDSGGKPLFKNHLMDEGLWQRFLFVDATGSGDYYLESSNILQAGD